MTTAALAAEVVKPQNEQSREQLAETLIDLLFRYIATERPDDQMRYTIRDSAGISCGYFTAIAPKDSPEFAAEMLRRKARAEAGETEVMDADEFLASIKKEWNIPD